MLKIVIASTNSGKINEFQTLFSCLKVDLVTPSSINLHLDIPETGSTYIDNASLKAKAWSRASGLPALADDTGLEVDALGGAPGLHSARLVLNGSDSDRRLVLLTLLKDKPRPWTAHFHCTVVLSTPDGSNIVGAGDCFGEIIPVEHGQHGFGYDPIFQLKSIGKTLAELSTSEKNTLSHRALAVQDLLTNPEFRQLIDSY